MPLGVNSSDFQLKVSCLPKEIFRTSSFKLVSLLGVDSGVTNTYNSCGDCDELAMNAIELFFPKLKYLLFFDKIAYH